MPICSTFPLRPLYQSRQKSSFSSFLVLEPDIEQIDPFSAPNRLAGRYFVLFPNAVRIRLKDRIGGVFRPRLAVGARGVSDRVRLVLLAPGIAHFEELLLFVPDDVGAHDGDLFPVGFRNENRIFRLARPVNSVVARREANARIARRLARIPHVVAPVVTNDARAVNELLPAGIGRGEHNLRLAPVDSVFALRIAHRLFRAP